jgi:5'-deoxynucleotidase YfbR-like HD superfamily hydrolase
MGPNASLVDLLIELQALDRVPRMGYLLRGVGRAESVTEHCWHVLFLVWALGKGEPDLDLHRAIEMALVHDLAELRIGDLPRTVARYFPPGAKATAEAAALDEILAPLPPSTTELWREYHAGTSGAARFVKACDKLQLMIKVSAYERWGEGALAEFWHNPDNFPDGGFASVRAAFAALRDRHDAERRP